MNYITLNGVSSNTITGLLIQELPPISLPKMRTEINEIDGRDGDIVTELGYSAYDKEISIGLHGSFDINQVIAFFASKGTVIFSNEPDKYYRYQVIEQIDFERLVRYRTATVKMHVQPFKYDAEETEIDEDGGEVLTGDIVSFNSVSTDPLTDVKVSLSPVQNLNGYTNPWVGGAGVNIIGDFGLSNTPSAGDVSGSKQADGSTYTLSGTAGALRDIYFCPIGEHAIDVGDYILYAPTGTGINGTGNYLYVSIYNGSTTRFEGAGGSSSSKSFTIEAGESLRGIFIRVASGVNVTGKIVTPMIVKGTTAPTSYSPYSNICPISGWDEANVYHTGKNLADSSDKRAGKVLQSTATIGNVPSLTNSTASDVYAKIAYVKANCTYTLSYDLSASPSSNNLRAGCICDDDDKVIQNGLSTWNHTVSYLTITPTVSGWLWVTMDNTVTQVQLEVGSTTATSYETYDGDTYSFTFSDTVYGGTLDVTSGVLMITHAKVTATISNTVRTSGGNFYVSVADSIRDGNVHTLLSNVFKSWNSSIGTGTLGICFINGSGALRFNPTSAYATVSEMLSAIGELYFVYQLATPTTVSLTATEVDALLGINNIWSAEGTVEVTVPNILTVTNKGNTIARPRMTIYGSGNVNVIINGVQVFSIAMGDIGYITIDGEQMEATQGEGVLKNRLVTGDYADFVLQSGENIIALTGAVTEVQISNYSRWL